MAVALLVPASSGKDWNDKDNTLAVITRENRSKLVCLGWNRSGLVSLTNFGFPSEWRISRHVLNNLWGSLGYWMYVCLFEVSYSRDNTLSIRLGNQRIPGQSRWTSRVPSRNRRKYLVFSCWIRERRRKSSPSYSLLSMCNSDADNFPAYIHLRRSEKTRWKENQQNKQ